MKIARIHSHLNGHEWILVHQPKIWREIEEVVKNIDAHQCMTKVSEEKTMRGKLLYSPAEINKRFKKELEACGWSEVRRGYWLRDELIAHFLKHESGVPKGVAVQLGSGFPDFFGRHLMFFTTGKINVGVDVLPLRQLATRIPGRSLPFEDALEEMTAQGRSFPPAPLVLVGIAA